MVPFQPHQNKFLVITTLLIIFLLFGVGPAAAHDKNSSTENLATDNCTELRELKRVQLVASNRNITVNSPGRIEGAVQLDPRQDCPVVVEVSLSASVGMYFSEGHGPGHRYQSAEFTLDPKNQLMKSFSTEVHSRETGLGTVDSQVKYWPLGHPELARMVNTTDYTFQVKEPSKQYDTTIQSDPYFTEILSYLKILIILIISIAGVWVFLKN